MKLTIEFGGRSPSIHEQLDRQGATARSISIRHWQKDADAITRLVVRGALTKRECEVARRRLLKDIVRWAEPKTKTNGGRR